MFGFSLALLACGKNHGQSTIDAAPPDSSVSADAMPAPDDVIVPTPPCNGRVGFPSVPAITTLSTSILGFEIADLDGDGKLDGFFNDGAIEIAWGHGDGDFDAPVGSGIQEASISSMLAIDVDGDGKLDIVEQDPQLRMVGVARGLGNRTFASPARYPSDLLGQLTSADLNGDGKPDLVGIDGGKLGVLLNNGSGGFGALTTYTAGSTASTLAVGDLTGDGKPDVVIADEVANNVLVFFNNGSGAYMPPNTYAAGGGPWHVAIGDMTGDGQLDVVVELTTQTATAKLEIFENTGGLLNAPVVIDTPARSQDGLALADLDGNGKLDVIWPSAADGLLVFLAQGNGFAAPTAYGRQAYVAAVGDLDGNGKLDIVAGGRALQPYLNDGTGHFPDYTRASGDANQWRVAIGDLDHDTHADLVITAGFGFDVFMGTGAGTFPSHINYTAASRQGAVAIADLNMDGQPDVVTADQTTQDVSVFANSGSGTFGPGQMFAAGTYPVAMVVTDLDGDGYRDVVTANYTDGTVAVLPGHGDGSLGAAETHAATMPKWLAIGDFDGDARKDVVVVRQTGALTILLNRGSLVDGASYTNVSGAIRVGDVNEDGIPDIVSGGCVLLGAGNGTFTQRFIPNQQGVFDLALRDMDGDQHLDIVFLPSGAPGFVSPYVEILYGHGDGTFDPPRSFSVGGGSIQAVADVNGDNRPDIVAADGGGNVTVLLNTCGI